MAKDFYEAREEYEKARKELLRAIAAELHLFGLVDWLRKILGKKT